MRQPILIAAILLWAGVTLLLGTFHWFRRRSFHDRLRPYVDGVAAPESDDSTSPVARLLGPLASDVGAAVAKLVGVDEDLGRRLERVHSDLSPIDFRLRQTAWVAATTALAIALAILIAPPPVVTLLVVTGAPTLAFLLIESELSRRSERWKKSVLLELPVVSEQLGMLLSAGYSMGGSLVRLAARSSGCIAIDLKRVVARVGHGIDEISALREWAETVDVPAVHRLVGVLSLDREAGDLGRLITNESRAVRNELHRELVEVIEKRGQQVWIPVTVATLVPGVLFLAVPFADALRIFTSS